MTTNTENSYEQGYIDGLAAARQILSKKADMIDRLLYSDEAMTIKWHATGSKFDAILIVRSELQHKAIALWEAIGKLYEEEKKAMK